MATSGKSILLALIALLILVSASYTYQCALTVETIKRITHSPGQSQTSRDNARCICTDSKGRVHITWDDRRSGEFEIYYASIMGDSVGPEVRITDTVGKSLYPCIACDSQSVYILWHEYIDDSFEILYVHLRDGKEIARKRITHNPLDCTCPVAAVGPDGSLHIAWHEGPLKQTIVTYGKIIDDSLVATAEICTEHPEAFRPDIACDHKGRALVTWFEATELKSRLWDGTSWGEETLAATNHSRPWRLSLTSLSDGRWVVVWFDKVGMRYSVYAKFYDGKAWYGQTMLSGENLSWYPSITRLDDSELAVVWEEKDAYTGEYLLALRCYNGVNWSSTIEIIREEPLSRYCSLASFGDKLHAIWFSNKPGNKEIYYSLLWRK